jgi:TRAP-type uncharacterized transport system fused permease subunit
MLSWKYTLPAFLVPFVFTVKPGGAALLLQGAAGDVVLVTLTTIAGVVVVAIGAGGYFWRRPLTMVERLLVIGAGLTVLALA